MQASAAQLAANEEFHCDHVNVGFVMEKSRNSGDCKCIYFPLLCLVAATFLVVVYLTEWTVWEPAVNVVQVELATQSHRYAGFKHARKRVVLRAVWIARIPHRFFPTLFGKRTTCCVVFDPNKWRNSTSHPILRVDVCSPFSRPITTPFKIQGEC